MNVSAFRTVRGRLLALMVLVVVPIAVVIAITATVTYRSVLAAIEASERQTVGNFSVRTRIWYREALRSLMGVVAGATADSPSDCAPRALRGVQDMHRVVALGIRFADGSLCRATKQDGIDDAAIAGLLDALSRQPASGVWTGIQLAQARYGVATIGGERFLTVYARWSATGPQHEAVLVVDARLLDLVFDLGEIAPGVIVALVRRGGEVITARGVSEADRSWLPRTEQVSLSVTRWVGEAASGRRSTFASQMVAEPDLYVLARFDEAAMRAAFLQFIALLLTPLLTLAVLFAAYGLAIDANIIRWIRGIEQAAVARASNQPVLAPVDAAMPEDIRRVSEAFNALVREQAERMDRLNQTIEANRYLVRELHHRVKNSLQVIQSYVGLARRHHGVAHRAVLAEVEAKVYVLSIAYRHALAEGEMRPVELKAFLEEVERMLNGLLDQNAARLAITVEPNLALVVDRAIPLGLLVVELAIHGRARRMAEPLALHLRASGDDAMVLTLAAGALAPPAADSKVAHGLLRQLEANALQPAEGKDAGWRFPV